MGNHSSVLAWRIPWTEEPGGVQCMGSQELDTTYWLNHHRLNNDFYVALVSSQSSDGCCPSKPHDCVEGKEKEWWARGFSSGGCAFSSGGDTVRAAASRVSAWVSLARSMSCVPLTIIGDRKETFQLLPPLQLRQVREMGARGRVWVSQPTLSAVILLLWGFSQLYYSQSGLYSPHNATYFCAQMRYLIRLHISAVKPHDCTLVSGSYPSFLVWYLCSPPLVNTLMPAGFHPGV